MKTNQFLNLVRQYSELARRTRTDYSDLIDAAAGMHLQWRVASGEDQQEAEAKIAQQVERNYDPAFRSYKKPVNRTA